jgi:sorbitol-specific phosphotransferase system component IIBC
MCRYAYYKGNAVIRFEGVITHGVIFGMCAFYLMPLIFLCDILYMVDICLSPYISNTCGCNDVTVQHCGIFIGRQEAVGLFNIEVLCSYAFVQS